MLYLCRCFILFGALLGSLLLQGCLSENADPQTKAETNSSGKYYASSLGAVALQIQNAVLKDSSWFVKVREDSSIDFAQYGLSQPQGISAEIKSSICPLSSGKELKQITWINGENVEGKFVLKEIGTDLSDIMVSLRERVGSNQMGTYRGNGSIALSNGTRMPLPATCQNVKIPLGAPVVVFSISHPAQPAMDFARTEYRSVSCGVDANNRPLRGVKVESRTVTFSTAGVISPTDPTEGWKPEDIGKCLEDVQVTIDSHERSDQSSSVLSNFAGTGSSIKNTLDDQLKMNCTKMTVSVNGKDNDKWTFNNCANATASGVTALGAVHVGNDSDERQISCSGLMRDTSVTISGVQASINSVAWASDAENIVTLKRDITLNKINGQLDVNENNRERWVGDSLDCKATETVKIACADIPGAPALQDRLSNNYTKTLLSPDGITAYAVNMDYYTGTWLTKDGGVTLNRAISATDWIDAETFTPKIVSDNWKIVNDECAWSQRTLLPPENAGELPTYDPAKQGNWTPTHSAGFRPVTIMAPVEQGTGNQATDYAYDVRQNGDYATYIEIMNALGGNGTNGNGTSGTGTNSNGTSGNGANGNGAGGAGTNGTGTNGSGASGNGTNGNNVYAPSDYMKSWEVEIPDGTRVITLLNHGDSPTHEGIISSSKTQIDDNNNLSVVPNGFAEPVRFGVDDKYEWTVPLYRYVDDVLVETTTVTLTYSEYREWSGLSYTEGSWSLPSITKVTNTDGVDRGGPWDDREHAPKSFEERTYSTPVAVTPTNPVAVNPAPVCPAVSDPACPNGTLIANAADANGCPTAKTCQTTPLVCGQTPSNEAVTSPCVIALGEGNTCTSGAISVNGPDSNMLLPSCGIMGNAIVTANGTNSRILGREVGTTTLWLRPSVTGTVATRTNLIPAADPFANIVLPDFSGLPNYGDVTCNGNSLCTLKPGKYSSINIGSNGSTGNVVMQPGIYVVDNFSVAYFFKGQLRGDGVVLVMKGAFDCNSGDVHLTGLNDPSSPLNGFVLFQNNQNPAYNLAIRMHGIECTAKMDGHIYAPKGNVQVNGGNNTLYISPTKKMVVRQIQANGINDHILELPPVTAPAAAQCPALGNAPQNQSDCDRQEWAGGPAYSFVNGGTDANGCPRANSCHQETFDECVSRTDGYIHTFDWHGTIIRGLPDYGCCQAYYPGGQSLNAGHACTGYYPQVFGMPRN